MNNIFVFQVKCACPPGVQGRLCEGADAPQGPGDGIQADEGDRRDRALEQGQQEVQQGEVIHLDGRTVFNFRNFKNER